MWLGLLTIGHLEKLLSLSIADIIGVNVHESKRERSRIIRSRFCGVRGGATIFRGAHNSDRDRMPFRRLQASAYKAPRRRHIALARNKRARGRPKPFRDTDCQGPVTFHKCPWPA